MGRTGKPQSAVLGLCRSRTVKTHQANIQRWEVVHRKATIDNALLQEQFSPGPWLLVTHVCCVESYVQAQDILTVTEQLVFRTISMLDAGLVTH